MIEEIGIRNIYGHKSFVYKLFLKKSYVFMRINETPYYNSERYIVIVDSKKFYKEWTGQTIEQCRIYEKWEQRKYDDAIDGFSRGIDNPVPLAEVEYLSEISFLNGITRTKWLIMNGANCFPLECSRKSAKNIFQKLSYDGKKIENAFRLFRQ
jgi:hypothetical protein